MVLGSTDDSPFSLGLHNASFKTFFLIGYYLSTFMILIHLVNMLIAIMGETFTRRNDAAT